MQLCTNLMTGRLRYILSEKGGDEWLVMALSDGLAGRGVLLLGRNHCVLSQKHKNIGFQGWVLRGRKDPAITGKGATRLCQ